MKTRAHPAAATTTAASPPQPASLRRRLVVMLYETMPLLGVLSVTFMLPHLFLGMGWSIVLPGGLLLTHVMLVLAVYFIWFWAHGGQTLAMQTWKIRLVSVNGEPPSRNQLYLRFILCGPTMLFFGAGLAWALFDRERQFLHDRLAGTRLIFVPAKPASAPPPAKTAHSA